TELVYHREDTLTYYIYTREIAHSAGTFIGLCYVFNSVLVTDFSFLFDVFEDTITNIVVIGELLEFTNDGSLSTKVSQLYTKTEELQRVSDYMNSKLSSLGRYAEKLPAANFAISNTEWKDFTIDEVAEARNVVKDYSNIRIRKGKDYDTASLKGYAQKLRTQNDEIKRLNDEIFKQKDEISTLEKQKKQIKWVLFLMILIVVGGISFYYYAQDKIQIIQNKSDKITELNKTIDNKNLYIQSLQSDSAILADQLNTTKGKLSTIHSELENMISPYLYFNSWTSTNYGQPNSKSQMSYIFYAYENDELQIPYFVSSEGGYDYLEILLRRNGYSTRQLLKESGTKSGTCSYTFSANDSYQLIVSYSKDGSNNHNNDKAGVNHFYIYRPIVNRLLQLSK
ncbi:MAG: hypothetical protein J5719_04380, partial [Bacteroidales bacterium]|nr:hypothetical protein [Bacteroidales bacterium]